jgi:hypothetical protein
MGIWSEEKKRGGKENLYIEIESAVFREKCADIKVNSGEKLAMYLYITFITTRKESTLNCVYNGGEENLWKME